MCFYVIVVLLTCIRNCRMEGSSPGNVVQPTVSMAANIFKKLCYTNKNDLLAGIIVAGWDPIQGGSVYNIPLGGSIHKQPYAIGGSVYLGFNFGRIYGYRIWIHLYLRILRRRLSSKHVPS